MTNRVLLGDRGGSYGLWVSKPGIDVTTGNDPDDMMLSINSKSLQIVASGIVSSGLSSGATINVTIPDLGFYPMILFNCGSYRPYLAYNSHSSISFLLETYSYASGGLSPQDPSLRYAVTNINTGL